MVTIKRILVTGGAGFIGSNLVNQLSATNQVVVVDDLSMGSKENVVLNKNVFFVEGDVTDSKLLEQLITEWDFHYIFHFAAIASVADSIARPFATHQVNFDSVLGLLELLRKKETSLERLVFASSAAVYGDEPSLPKRETSEIRPLSPYAIDKFSAERYCLDYSLLYGLPTTVVRFFNVYGKNQNPKSPYSGVISLIMEQFTKQSSEGFTIFGDGEQTRDFVYIKDVLRALTLVVSKKESIGKVYNVGTGKATSLLQLLTLFEQLFGKQIPLSYAPMRQGDIPASYGDIHALQELGYTVSYDIEMGLTDYLQEIAHK